MNVKRMWLSLYRTGGRPAAVRAGKMFLSALMLTSVFLQSLQGADGNSAPPFPSGKVRSSLPDKKGSEASEVLLHIQQEIRDLRSRAYEEKKSALQRIRELNDEKRFRERTIKVIDEAVSGKKEKIAGQEKKIADLKEEAKGIRTQLGKVGDTLQEFCDRLAVKVSKGIPWKKDARMHEVKQVKELAKGPHASPSSTLAGIGRIQRDEEALGRLVETATLTLNVDGESIAVQGFHLGALGVAYVNDEGTIIGFCGAGETMEQGIENLKDKPAASEGYLKATDILRRRRTPVLINIYLPQLPFTKAKENEK